MGDGFVVRILAVDPGDARIGIAVSDPLGVVARPLLVFEHVSRSEDAQRIVELAHEHDAQTILIGIPLDQNGEIGPQARKSLRLVEEIQSITDLTILTWDESGSTEAASSLDPSNELLDARAAAVTLQDYLDVQSA
jgi:putative Holliday junction resolvase